MDKVFSLIRDRKNAVDEKSEQSKDKEHIFDAVFSNPPYQLTTVNGAVAIYHHFMNVAETISKRISMIYPAKWTSTGRGEGLISFREKELRSTHYSSFVIRSGEDEVFENAVIKGGVNYFLWSYDNDKEMMYDYNGVCDERKSLLNNFPIMIHDPTYYSIINKVNSQDCLRNIVSSRNYYGQVLESARKIEQYPVDENGLTIFYNDTSAGLKKMMITRNCTVKETDDYKVFISRTADPSSKTVLRRPARIFIAEPDHICSSTFLKIGSFNNRDEAINLLRYIKTDFVNFLFATITQTHNTTKANYVLIPNIDFSTGEIKDRPGVFLNFDEPEKLDEELFNIYEINEFEQEMIRTSVRHWKDKIDLDVDGLYGMKTL